MQVSQEKIVEYLKHNFWALSKDSDDDEISMFEFLRENKLMTPTPNNGLSINNEGQSFIRNAYVFNPVPLNIHDWKMNIINKLKDGQVILNVDGQLYQQAYNELKQDGIIEQVGKSYFTTLTTKGRQFIFSNSSYNDWLTNYGKPTTNTIHNGHNINAPVSLSDLSTNDQSLNKEISSKAVIPQNRSLTEYINWIVGIIGGLIIIYEFVIKHFLK